MKLKRTLLLAGLLASGVAFAALTKDQLVYVKAKNTKLLQKPDATAKVTDTLQPGDEVKWQKAEGKEFHFIKTKAGEGYVYFSNLSLKKPEQEFKNGKPVDTAAFASSGAATKALGDGAVEYGRKIDKQDAVKDVLAMEAIAEKTSTAQVAEHQKAAGLNPVVGEGK